MFLCCCNDDDETAATDLLLDRVVDPGVILGESQKRGNLVDNGIKVAGKASKCQEPKEPSISEKFRGREEQPNGEVKTPAVEKPKNNEPPPPMLQKRIVEIRKSSESEALGVTLDIVEGASVVVETIHPECRMANHNDENQANPTQLVFVGDRITALNGITGDISLILGRLRNDKDLTLEVETPKILELFLPLSVKSHGLDLGVDQRKKTIYVKGIEEGCIREWCASHGQKISAGDRIVEVNGIAGSALAVQEQMQTIGQKAARMVVWHYE